MQRSENESVNASVAVSDLSIIRDGRTLFSSMNWRLSPGEFLAVTGRSGAGKSSLLAAIAGSLTPASGSIDVAAPSTGVVFQDLRLTAELSVLTNVLCGRLGRYEWWRSLAGFSSGDRLAAYNILQTLDIAHLCHRPVRNISGGEQQRTAIARVLFQEPDIILADEPTSNLDNALSHHVLASIRSECRTSGRSAICILHDREFVERYADIELRIDATIGNGWELRRLERQSV